MSSTTDRFRKEKTERPYLEQRLRWIGDALRDESGSAVMMAWEAPIMEASALAVAKGGGDVLNVGFGLGLIDEAIQRLRPASHTIVEAHPDVYQRMVERGWDRRAGVRVIHGTWQEVWRDLPCFDGIFWDTWAEAIEPFHQVAPSLLRRGGRYSFFNNGGPSHVISISEKQLLERLGFELSFASLQVKAPPGTPQRSDGRLYWDPAWSSYYVPLARWVHVPVPRDAVPVPHREPPPSAATRKGVRRGRRAVSRWNAGRRGRRLSR